MRVSSIVSLELLPIKALVSLLSRITKTLPPIAAVPAPPISPATMFLIEYSLATTSKLFALTSEFKISA